MNIVYNTKKNLKIHVQNLIYICVPEFQRCLTLLDTVSVPFGRLALLILAAFCRTLSALSFSPAATRYLADSGSSCS